MSTDVARWLAALGTLVAGSLTETEARARISAFVPLLSQRFPPEAFTAASLEDVAAQCRFFPAYAEIVEHLGRWWRDHRPIQQRYPAVAAPEPPQRHGPSAEEIAAVDALLADWRAEMAAKRAAQPRRHGEGIQPRYLRPDELRAAYQSKGLPVPAHYSEDGSAHPVQSPAHADQVQHRDQSSDNGRDWDLVTAPPL